MRLRMWMTRCRPGGMILIACLVLLTCALVVLAPANTGEPPGIGDNSGSTDVVGMRLWTGRFRTGTTDEVVLVADPQFRLYVVDGELVYERGEQSRVLFRWERDLPAEALAAGTHLLIGIDDAIGEWPWADRWLVVDTQTLPVPSVTAISTSFGPAQLLDVRYHADIGGLFVTVESNPGYSQPYYELYYDPRQWDFRLIYYDITPREQRTAAQPERIAPVRAFDRVARHRVDGLDIWALEDDRGTVVCSLDGGYVRRFVGRALTDLIAVDHIRGQKVPLGRFRAPDGSALIAVIGPECVCMLCDDRLFAGGWIQIERYAFYRRIGDTIETFRYHYRDGEGMVAESRSYRVPGQYVTRSGSLLEYRVDGQRRWLSLFDLIDVGSVPPVSELWLRHAPIHGRGDSPPRERSLVSVHLPLLSRLHPRVVPEEVLDVVPDVYGDHNPGHTFSLIDGVWHLLQGNCLLVHSGSRFDVIGRVPVGDCGGLTAQDFLRQGAGWVIADTFGDRVILLNDQLVISAEFPVTLPWSLRTDREGLWVRAVDGWTLLDADLRPVRRVAVSYEATVTNVRELDAAAVLIDTGSGITWACHWQWLHRVRADGQSRSVFVGWVDHLPGRGSVIPFGDQVLLLLDGRVHLFGRDGEHRRTIRFERLWPDRRCAGESSWQLDHDTGKLYLVQGFRVLEIDLATGTVRTLFTQEHWGLGCLIHTDGRLYLTATVGREEQGRPGSEYTELLVYDIETGRLARWLMTDICSSERLTEDGSLLLRISDPGYGDSRRYVVVSPAALTGSE